MTSMTTVMYNVSFSVFHDRIIIEFNNQVHNIIVAIHVV
jgi:hypothetical protein